METTRKPGVQRAQRVTKIVFTVNHYTPDELESLMNMSCKWIIIAKELGPKNGIPHLQGAIVLNRPMTFKTISTLPGLTRAHVEQMKGSCEDSLIYCTKEDPNAFVKGEMPNPGKRTDLIDCTSMINAGTPLAVVAREYPSQFVRYHKGLIAYRGVLLEGRKSKPQVIWIWGKSGTGKTRAALDFASTAGSFWISNGSLRWFDGYHGQRTAILDDFRDDACKFDHLLRYLDRYEIQVEFKGGFVQWIPEFIIITAPSSPKAMFYALEASDFQQLDRRIDHVLEFPADDKPGRLFRLFGVPEPTPLVPLDDEGGGEGSSSNSFTMVMSSDSSTSEEDKGNS